MDDDFSPSSDALLDMSVASLFVDIDALDNLCADGSDGADDADDDSV
jgi:hypothetical protein